jgi:hypothetical protein
MTWGRPAGSWQQNPAGVHPPPAVNPWSAVPRKATIVLGHRHIGALTSAIANRRFETADQTADGVHVALFEAWAFNGDPPYVTKTADGEDIFNPDIVAAAHAACAGCDWPVFVTLFGGNAHSVLSLMQHQRPFDFVLPEAADLPVDLEAEILPAAYVQAVLQAQMDRYLYQLYQLRRAVSDRILALAPPPPIGDDAFIAGKLDAFFHQNFAGRALAAPALRRKMWLLQTRLQKRLCNEIQVGLIEPPEESRTPDGFLAPACYGHDATHGGARYGELLLQQIEELHGAPIVSYSTFSIKGP